MAEIIYSKQPISANLKVNNVLQRVANMADRTMSEMSTRRNEKRDTDPMYIKSKYVTKPNDMLGYRNQSLSRRVWKSNDDDVISEKVFLERRNLISQWYQSWNEIQRKRFFDIILDQSSYPELKFILSWFKKPVHSQLDFTTLLPRVVSTHIFSFLDPRSLCRAASVSWHWKWLVEQDSIWKSKCLKFGWYLPYKPSELENGAWKRHYIMCIRTLDIELPQKSMNLLRGKYSNIAETLKAEKNKRQSDIAAKTYKKWKKNVPLVHKDEPIRPPWIANSFRPKELEHAEKALFGKISAGKLNSLTAQQSEYKLRNKHFRSKTTPSQMTDYAISRPTQQLFKQSKSEEFSLSREDVPNPNMLTLSEATRSEILGQREIVDNTDINGNILENIIKSSQFESSQLYSQVETKKAQQESSMAYPDIVNPRVIFISSQISANELLANAVLHGVLPIVYEYEGTTLSGLLDHFTAVLQGRKARTVGLFASGESGSLLLTRECTISQSSLNDPEIQHFWQSLSINIVFQDQGGHVDIFYPLGGTDAGMELLSQLQIMTGLTFSSPSGVASALIKVSDDASWLAVPEEINKLPYVYFNELKLTAWSRAAEYIQESLSKVRIDLSGHFEDEIHGLAANIVGEIMFKALGLVEMSELQDLSNILVKALVLATQQKHVEKAKPITNLIHCLQECEKGQNPRKKRAKTKNNVYAKGLVDEKEPLREGENDHSEDEFDSTDEHFKLKEQTTNLNITERLSLKERRTVIAHEILTTEKEYCNTLTIIQDVFRKPLEASVKANRPMIGSANIRMIFNDSETLLALNKELENDLSCRLQDWDSHQVYIICFWLYPLRWELMTSLVHDADVKYLFCLTAYQTCCWLLMQFSCCY